MIDGNKAGWTVAHLSYAHLNSHIALSRASVKTSTVYGRYQLKSLNDRTQCVTMSQNLLAYNFCLVMCDIRRHHNGKVLLVTTLISRLVQRCWNKPYPSLSNGHSPSQRDSKLAYSNLGRNKSSIVDHSISPRRSSNRVTPTSICAKPKENIGG